MSLVAKSTVTCPACGLEQQLELVHSINTQQSPALKEKLLAGELNRFTCSCGKHATLAGDLLFVDPVANYWCRVCVGDETAMERAIGAFKASGATGTQRVVPSLNALVEKVKLLDAALDDWAVEMMKVLLLASTGNTDLNSVLLFESLDRDAGVLRWVLFDGSMTPRSLSTPIAPYEKHLPEWKKVAPVETDLLIDRKWAVEALQRIMPLPV